MAEFSFTKWGASDQFGTSGGVVTWSLVGPGVTGLADEFDTGRSDVTVDGAAALSLDVEGTLRASFAAWSAVSDIRFLQVEDGGAPIGDADVSDIRVSFGEIDGAAGEVLGLSFFPASSPIGGDILIDAAELDFFSRPVALQAVLTHEIGHSIGLDHEDDVLALMNSMIGNDARLRADDIDGAQTIYGAAVGGPTVFALTADRRDVTIAEMRDDLTVIGTAGDDRVLGGGGRETLRGGSGDDTLDGGGFGDVLRGQAGADELSGRGGRDDLGGGGGDDAIAGGRGADVIRGGGGADALAGGDGADLLRGEAGDDLMGGGKGKDTLRGGAGDDTMTGGFGDDMLFGGGGSDVFVFGDGAVRDVIGDFEVAFDRIDLVDRTDVSDRSDFGVFDSAAGAVLILGGGDLITLTGVEAAELDESVFLF